MMFYRHFGKRCLDLIVTVPLLIILAPAVLCVALLVWLNLGSPILFRMQRPGFKGTPFTIYKFRTMRDSINEYGQVLPDNERQTVLGRLLRDMSFDELPELYNVLKGDMSLVGPRPLRMEFLECYTTEEMRRHDVLPGVTGWAQIKGRNSIGLKDKVDLDLWYVNHQSWWLDTKILLLTVPKVIFRENVKYPENATVAHVLRTHARPSGKKDCKG